MTTARPRRRPEPPAGLACPQDMTEAWFPRLAARDLDGREVMLPAGLPGEWTVVIVAFRRQQQELAGSWVPWLEQRAAADPRLGFAGLPAIGLQWRHDRSRELFRSS